MNTLAPWVLTQALLPILPGEGRLVNLSSAAQARVDIAALRGARTLDDIGWTALVAAAVGDGVNDLVKAGIEHVAMPLETKTPLAMRRNARRLAALIRERGVDLVHARSRAPAWSAA